LNKVILAVNCRNILQDYYKTSLGYIELKCRNNIIDLAKEYLPIVMILIIGSL